MKKFLVIVFLVCSRFLMFGQTNSLVIKYDSIKIITSFDTTIHKVDNYFYFNSCSIVLISELSRIYDILIPAVNDFDVTGIRVFEDTNTKIDDGGFIYESNLHKRQVAIYFSEKMKTVKILKKDKTGIIFY